MLNLHCNNNDKIKHKKIKNNNNKRILRLPRFDPGIYIRFKVHQGINYAMEVNAIF